MSKTELQKKIKVLTKAASDFCDQISYCRASMTIMSVRELELRSDILRLALVDANESTKSLLYNHLVSYGYGWRACLDLRKALGNLFYTLKSNETSQNCPLTSTNRIYVFLQVNLPVAQAISELDKAVLVPASGRWSDPALANLIAAVEPIWRRVTNLTAARTSETESRFIAWLNELLPFVGRDKPVPLGFVLDIMRSKKNRHTRIVDRTG